MLAAELLDEARRFAALGLLPSEIARRLVELAQAQGCGAVYEVAAGHRAAVHLATGERIACDGRRWRVEPPRR